MNKQYNLSRRQILKGLGLTATTCILPINSYAIGAESESPVLVEAVSGQSELLGKGLGQTAVWSYNGMVPGPVIRVKQNQDVHVRFKNSLKQPSTIHWHGVRIDNKMDGVVGLTQDAVLPGKEFAYKFKAPDAGTYWYHPHNKTWEQLARGMYGLLIVDEEKPIAVDHDIALALDDWQLKRNGQLETESMGQIGEWAHGGRTGNVLTVNGKPGGSVQVKSGDRTRVRLCNTANSRILSLHVQGCSAQTIALDGQPVAPKKLDSGVVILAPAQRVDLILDFDKDPGSRAVISEVSEIRVPLMNFIYDEKQKSIAPKLNAPIILSDNGLAKMDLSNPLKVTLDMTGGAMGRMEKARVNGKELSIDELVRKHKMVWAFNGNAGMPEKPLFSAKRGQTVELTILNNTAWPHAMHIHGHHMQEIERKSRSPERSALFAAPNTWRDTILMDTAETVKVAFVADNPGKWAFHCHMIEHQAGGMMTWFEVV